MSRNWLRRRLRDGLLTVLCVVGFASVAIAQTLGISGNRFTVDGTPKFLVFVSYFDALDVPDGTAIAEFDQLKAWGVDGIRIFPNWWTCNPCDQNTFAGDTVIAPDGSIQEGPFSNMVWYLDRARERGLLVDVSFSAETVSSCADCPANFALNDLTFDGYLNGIREVASRLSGSGYRHVLFDIQNESNINGPDQRTPLSDAQVSAIIQAVRSVDGSRIVTASYDQHQTPAGAGTRANNTDQDVVAWHEYRNPNWWFSTYGWLQEIHGVTGKPVYLQEPERFRPFGTPGANEDWFTADGLKRAVKEAKGGCAAAWTFHTFAGFRMNQTPFLNQLAGVEWDFLSTFKAGLDGETWCQ